MSHRQLKIASDRDLMIALKFLLTRSKKVGNFKEICMELYSRDFKSFYVRKFENVTKDKMDGWLNTIESHLKLQDLQNEVDEKIRIVCECGKSCFRGLVCSDCHKQN